MAVPKKKISKSRRDMRRSHEALTSAAHVDTSTVRAYLFAIARNLYLQGLRRSRKHDALNDSLRDANPGPHERAQHRAELEEVLRRLQQLPEVDRAAVLMRAFQAAPYEDIARALGISLRVKKIPEPVVILAAGAAGIVLRGLTG